MNEDGMLKWVERLRSELSEAIDKCADLTDPCVVHKSMLLDEALNRYYAMQRICEAKGE